MSTVRQRGDSWQAIVRIKKGGQLVHSESQTFETEKLARAWADKVESKIKSMGVPARLLDKITFGELVSMYRAERDKFKPLGRSINSNLDLLVQHMGSARLDAMTPEFYTSFARKRRGPTTGPTTVLHNLSTVRTVLNSAKPMFGIDVDGSALTTAIQNLQLNGVVANSNKRSRRPTQAELDALVAEFERVWDFPSTKIPMQLIVPLAVELPRRIGELCAMEWADYTDQKVLLRDTKHPRRPRTETVPVPPKARAIIDSLPRIDARILPYRSESCSSAFDRACERLKIVDLHLHDLRHEGISRLFEQGLDIPQVAMISGHLSWTNLKRYTHLSPKDVLEKLNARK